MNVELVDLHQKGHLHLFLRLITDLVKADDYVGVMNVG